MTYIKHTYHHQWLASHWTRGTPPPVPSNGLAECDLSGHGWWFATSNYRARWSHVEKRNDPSCLGCYPTYFQTNPWGFFSLNIVNNNRLFMARGVKDWRWPWNTGQWSWNIGCNDECYTIGESLGMLKRLHMVSSEVIGGSERFYQEQIGKWIIKTWRQNLQGVGISAWNLGFMWIYNITQKWNFMEIGREIWPIVAE